MQPEDRIGQRIKLHGLRVLMTVVQAGSMRKAAALLSTTQPAVSRSIGELEHTIGVRLLDRTPQGVEPTAYGRALLDGGTAVFDDLRQAMKNIEFLADPSAGEVRVGCNAFLAASFASAVVDRLCRRYPRIMIYLTTGYYEGLRHDLSERNVDLLIARNIGPVVDERLDFEFLFDEPCIIAVGAHNPWARRRRITLADLLNERWVLSSPGGGMASIAREAFSASGLDLPRRTVTTDLPQVRMSSLATGRFLTIFPASVLRLPTQRLELRALPVELPRARVASGIFTLKSCTPGPVARLFIDTAHEVAQPLMKKK